MVLWGILLSVSKRNDRCTNQVLDDWHCLHSKDCRYFVLTSRSIRSLSIPPVNLFPDFRINRTINYSDTTEKFLCELLLWQQTKSHQDIISHCVPLLPFFHSSTRTEECCSHPHWNVPPTTITIMLSHPSSYQQQEQQEQEREQQRHPSTTIGWIHHSTTTTIAIHWSHHHTQQQHTITHRSITMTVDSSVNWNLRFKCFQSTRSNYQN